MMFAYIDIFGLKPILIPIADLQYDLDYCVWGEPNGQKHSANDVIANPEKYPDDAHRIHVADMTYPIIIDRDIIVDGAHRLTQELLSNQTTINAYQFQSIMDKFMIGDDWSEIQRIEPHELIILFYKNCVQ